MSDDNIVAIFKDRLFEDVVRIIDCSFGIEQMVKIVKTKKNIYIIKIPLQGNEMMILREGFACEKLRGCKIVPQVILKEKRYLIESFLEGKMASKIRFSAEEKKSVYISLGKTVRRIHKIKMQGFGVLQKDLEGKDLTLERHIDFLLRKNMPLLRKTGLLSEKEIKRVRDYLKVGLKFINQQESVLLHFDILDSNMLVSGGALSGIIDFGDLSCGPRAYDIAKFYIEKKDSEDFTNFLNGYGKVESMEVEYFAVCHLLYEIPYYHSIGNGRKCVKLLRLLEKIISNDKE